MGLIKYKKGYKYILDKTYKLRTEVYGQMVLHDLFELYPDGILIIKRGYAWNGADVFPDIRTIMRGSLVHDCFCQMINEGYIPEHLRDDADKELRKICLNAGMSKPVAWGVYKAVRAYSKHFAEPKKEEILTAP